MFEVHEGDGTRHRSRNFHITNCFQTSKIIYGDWDITQRNNFHYHNLGFMLYLINLSITHTSRKVHVDTHTDEYKNSFCELPGRRMNRLNGRALQLELISG